MSDAAQARRERAQRRRETWRIEPLTDDPPAAPTSLAERFRELERLRRVAVRFAIGECSLGSILVAATERGVCAILLGDDPEALAHELERRFARAQRIGADEGFEQLVAQVVGLVEAPQLGARLALDIRGTAFQQRVWAALLQIPAGQAVSYTELAQAIGAPTAARAVAQACAANPLAVAIPCHRVVRTNGALSGYRWGVERKRELLEREGYSGRK